FLTPQPPRPQRHPLFPYTTLFRSVGCTVFPGGVGNSELQVHAAADLRPDGYAGTPSFLKVLLDKAEDLGVPLPSIRKALVGGERSEEHTSELQSRGHLVCRLLLEK